MAEHIHKCSSCGKYTLKEECSCGSKALFPRPPKFSLKDKYGELRRKAKKKEWKESGIRNFY